MRPCGRTKRDRADQFSRRMHKEAPLTKQQKEEIRRGNMLERDQFDVGHLGNFSRSFPNPDNVSAFLEPLSQGIRVGRNCK